MALSLDIQAQALLQVVQSNAGTIAADVEQKIEAAQQSGRLSAEQLAQVLVQAMPAQKQLIETAKQAALKYHPDGTNTRFLTQLIDLKIEKVDNIPDRNDHPVTPTRVDPLYAQFSMAPDADFLLLFNARDIDENGRPLLMKVVAREGADMTKLDLAKYRTQPGSQPDIVKVQDDAEFVDVQDQNESEFNFGDPLKAVALGRSFEELSALIKVKPVNSQVTKTWAWRWDGSRMHPDMINLRRTDNVVGDQLDRTGVAVFDQRVKLELGLDVDAWQTPILQPANVTAMLDVKRGLIFEPGAKASVSVLGATVSTAVATDDVQLLGSPSAQAKITLTGPMTLNQILDSQVSIGSSANGNDVGQITKRVRDIVYADAAKVTLGSKAVNPPNTRDVPRADFAASGLTITKDILNDKENDGQKVKIDVAAGLLSNNGASVQGWKLAVGYTDLNGKWVELGAQTVDNDKASTAMSFSFDVPDTVAFHRANAKIEVRAFTNSGFPAERLSVNYREVPWATPPARPPTPQG